MGIIPIEGARAPSMGICCSGKEKEHKELDDEQMGNEPELDLDHEFG